MQDHEQCRQPIDAWKTRCPEPIDGRDGGCFCTEHAIACCREEIAKCLALDLIRDAAEYAESLHQLGVMDCTELALAA